MRPTATAALILTVGLVVAACGGDDATPTPEPAEPTDAPTTATAAPADATASPADEPTPEPEPEFAKRAEQDQDGDPGATFALASGIWRVLWETETCERVEPTVTQVDGDFTFSSPSKAARATAIITALPEGVYTLTQLDEACTEWAITMNWMG